MSILSELQPVYTDKALCLATLKKHKGTRFKTFSSYDDALQFSINGPELAHNTSLLDASKEQGMPCTQKKQSVLSEIDDFLLTV